MNNNNSTIIDNTLYIDMANEYGQMKIEDADKFIEQQLASNGIELIKDFSPYMYVVDETDENIYNPCRLDKGNCWVVTKGFTTISEHPEQSIKEETKKEVAVDNSKEGLNWDKLNAKYMEEVRENTSLKARIEEINRLFHDLTSGGSEFANDPEYCAKWIRENRNSESKTLKEIIVSSKARIVVLENCLREFIEHDKNNTIYDEYSNDGDGHFDTWTSGELNSLLNKAKEALNQK